MNWNSSVSKGETPTFLMQSAEISAEHAEQARRTVAANASSVDDARTLLEMLGLVDPVSAPKAGVDAPAPNLTKPTVVEWIDTPGGRFRVCAGTCGSPIRLRTEPPSYHAKRDHGAGMCASCFRSRKSDSTSREEAHA